VNRGARLGERSPGHGAVEGVDTCRLAQHHVGLPGVGRVMLDLVDGWQCMAGGGPHPRCRASGLGNALGNPGRNHGHWDERAGTRCARGRKRVTNDMVSNVTSRVWMRRGDRAFSKTNLEELASFSGDRFLGRSLRNVVQNPPGGADQRLIGPGFGWGFGQLRMGIPPPQGEVCSLRWTCYARLAPKLWVLRLSSIEARKRRFAPQG